MRKWLLLMALILCVGCARVDTALPAPTAPETPSPAPTATLESKIAVPSPAPLIVDASAERLSKAEAGNIRALALMVYAMHTVEWELFSRQLNALEALYWFFGDDIPVLEGEREEDYLTVTKQALDDFLRATTGEALADDGTAALPRFCSIGRENGAYTFSPSDANCDALLLRVSERADGTVDALVAVGIYGFQYKVSLCLVPIDGYLGYRISESDILPL